MREAPLRLDEPFLAAAVETGELRTCDGLGLGTTRLQPGAAFPLHRHDHGEEIVVVTGGAVAVAVAGVESVLVPGDSIAIARGTPHDLRNPSEDEPALVAFIKVPFVPGDTIWL